MPSSDLVADTAVRRVDTGPGWYVADIPRSWSYVTPSGGVLMATAMRAMQIELAEAGFAPLSATTVFCSPVPHGPVEIRVAVLRKSGAAAQLRATLTSTAAPGPGLEVTATFARTREGPQFVDARMPDVPGPADCEPFHDGTVEVDLPFFNNVDMLLASGHRWWRDEWSPGEARFCRWLRYHVRPEDDAGKYDALALPALIDMMPPALDAKLGEARRAYHAPSLDLTVHFLAPVRADWILLHCHSRYASSGYATADVELWDESGGLVALGTQMMILRRRA